jgi:hypothetical protein
MLLRGKALAALHRAEGHREADRARDVVAHEASEFGVVPVLTHPRKNSGSHCISRAKAAAFFAKRLPTILIAVEAMTAARRRCSNWSRFWCARMRPTLSFRARLRSSARRSL